VEEAVVTSPVIPAKAGIFLPLIQKIPAFAGMTLFLTNLKFFWGQFLVYPIDN